MRDYMAANDIRTKLPTEAYRKGWDAIDWSKKRDPNPTEEKDDRLQSEQRLKP